MEAAYSFEPLEYTRSALWMLHCPVELYRHPLCALMVSYRMNCTFTFTTVLQATVLYAAPPLVLFLASHPGVLPKYLQSLRHVISGAAPLGGLDVERFLKRAPPNTDILQGSMQPLLYFTNVTICFLSALDFFMWPSWEHISKVGRDKRYSWHKIMTHFILLSKDMYFSEGKNCRGVSVHSMVAYGWTDVQTYKLLTLAWGAGDLSGSSPGRFIPWKRALVIGADWGMWSSLLVKAVSFCLFVSESEI